MISSLKKVNQRNLIKSSLCVTITIETGALRQLTVCSKNAVSSKIARRTFLCDWTTLTQSLQVSLACKDLHTWQLPQVYVNHQILAKIKLTTTICLTFFSANLNAIINELKSTNKNSWLSCKLNSIVTNKLSLLTKKESSWTSSLQSALKNDSQIKQPLIRKKEKRKQKDKKTLSMMPLKNKNSSREPQVRSKILSKTKLNWIKMSQISKDSLWCKIVKVWDQQVQTSNRDPNSLELLAIWIDKWAKRTFPFMTELL